MKNFGQPLKSSQGFAFIPDSVEEQKDDEIVLLAAKISLRHTLTTVRRLREFINKWENKLDLE